MIKTIKILFIIIVVIMSYTHVNAGVYDVVNGKDFYTSIDGVNYYVMFDNNVPPYEINHGLIYLVVEKINGSKLHYISYQVINELIYFEFSGVPNWWFSDGNIFIKVDPNNKYVRIKK